MTAHFFAQYLSENLEIICVFDKNETPIEFFIQQKERLNIDEVVSAKVVSYNKVLKGYFFETSKKASVFVPSTDKLSEGQMHHILILKEARLNKDATGKITTDEIYCPNLKEKVFQKYGPLVELQSIKWGNLIEEALESTIPFSTGANIVIERTNACWTIDLDSNKSTQSFAQLNKEALPHIAKEIILKNMSGMILIDFIGSKSFKEKQALLQEFKPLFQTDSRTRIYDFSKMNLLEIKRKTTSTPLIDVFYDKNGNKTPLYVLLLIKEALKNIKQKCILTIHPSLLPFLTDDIKSLVNVETNLNFKSDFFELKEI